MNKYKTLKAIFLVLALVMLVVTVILIFNPLEATACPLVNQPCPKDYSYTIFSGIIDLALWGGFVYFMGKYKILSWILFVLAFLILGFAVYYYFNPPVGPCPDTPEDMTFNLCPADYKPFGIAVIADIIFWLGFIYFLRKSKKPIM